MALVGVLAWGVIKSCVGSVHHTLVVSYLISCIRDRIVVEEFYPVNEKPKISVTHVKCDTFADVKFSDR